MNSSKITQNILCLFPHPIVGELARVYRGESPSERLYGFVELQQRGWPVQYSDKRFSGVQGRILKYLRRYGVHLLDTSTIQALRRADVVVIKDDFSLMASIVCSLFGTRLIYLDSMFLLPRRWWKRWVHSLSIRLSDQVIGYSRSQAARWARELGVAEEKFATLPYTIDTDFYEKGIASSVCPGDDYVLAVGRDMGRDYRTLVAATLATGMRLKLVTLPYLLKGLDLEDSRIEVLQHLSYDELFALYAGAAAVVVPLKKGIDYPSGVRAMLEAMILERPVIVSRTPALKDYVDNHVDVEFVDPEDVAELKSALLRVVNNREASRERAKLAKEKVMLMYGMSHFVDGFEKILLRMGADHTEIK